MSFGFIDYKVLRFSGLTDSTEPLYTATEHQAFITKINIVNLTTDVVWVSGKLTGDSGESFFDYRRAINPKESTELIGLPQFLDINDNLLIFSDDYTQLFDCIIDLQILNEKNDVI